MHQVTTMPAPLKQPSPRCVAPRIRPMSLPCEGFSHRNSRMLFHLNHVVESMEGRMSAGRRCSSKQAAGGAAAFTTRAGLQRIARWSVVAEVGASDWAARGTPWTSMELSPGDSSTSVRVKTGSGGIAAARCCGYSPSSGSVFEGLGLSFTDSMRNGRMPTRRASILKVTRSFSSASSHSSRTVRPSTRTRMPLW